MTEQMQTLMIFNSIFYSLLGVITLLFGLFVWFVKRLVVSLETLHGTTLPSMAEDLSKQTQSLKVIERQAVCRAPIATILPFPSKS